MELSEEEYKKIFSKNLNYYMNIKQKNQNDLIRDLRIDKSTISTWVNGTRLPRMSKIEMLANYFNIQKSDLIEDKVKIVKAEYGNNIDLTGLDGQDIEELIRFKEFLKERKKK